jgi:hypothetical protein
VLRRSEGTCFSSPSDDEVGGFQSAIRSERSEQSTQLLEAWQALQKQVDGSRQPAGNAERK